jgi:ATP-dependent Zn protease
MEGKPLVDGKAKSLVAYHEVGHAICGTLTPGHDPVQKVRMRSSRIITVLFWPSLSKGAVRSNS